MRILVVDDEELIRNLIREYLENEKYLVDEAIDGIMAIDKVKNNDYDLIIMDIMMPRLDGFSAVSEIKKIKDIPFIMLSAKSEEYDKLKGFDLGIDDYVTKPFSPKELMARVRAILKRNNISDVYRYKDLEVNFMARTIKINNKEISVTPKEFEILTYLINNKNIAISREQLLSKIWGYDFYGDDRTIDTHVKMLRNNLGKYRNLIITVRTLGYKFNDEK